MTGDQSYPFAGSTQCRNSECSRRMVSEIEKFSFICERGFTSIYAFFSNFMSPLIEVIDVNDNACEHSGHAYICTNVALSNSPRDLSIS